MAQLDDVVGSVMKYLKDNGLDDNTIVVFTTDNGAENFTWPDGGQTPFAGGKGTALEGGFRVPAIIRWPGKVPPGKVENAIISGLDWFPTFVAAAGNPNIADELKAGKQVGDRTFKVHLDGYNQMDLITEKVRQSATRFFTLLKARSARCVLMTINTALPISLMAGSARQKRSIGLSSSTYGSIHSSAPGMPNGKERVARLLQLVCLRILAVCLRAEAGCPGRAKLDRISADAKGSNLQSGRDQRADPKGNCRA